RQRIHREIYVRERSRRETILDLCGMITDFGVLSSFVYPWMAGGSLHDYLKREHPNLPAHRKLDILVQVADGIKYLHRQSIAHGNLTGDDLLLDASGRVHIADFSHSVILAEADSRIFSEQLPADARYISPERIVTGCQTLRPTKAGDVYSYGCLMFLQVLEGKVPYHYITRYEYILYDVLKRIRPIKPPASVVIDTDWDFIQRCWLGDAERRPSVEDILGFAEGRAGIWS
ncbi:kinase-like domain-containing protein, partial [Suillus subluteus]